MIYRRDPKVFNPPFALYVDEFHKFQTSGFEDVLADAGGLGLYLTLANQYFGQLHNSRLEEAIINLVSTFFLFNQDPLNAGILKDPPAPPPPDTKGLKEKIKSAQKQEDFWAEQSGGSNEARICFTARINLEEQLKEAERPVAARLTFLQKLPGLPPGKAVYRAADGETTIVKFPFPRTLKP